MCQIYTLNVKNQQQTTTEFSNFRCKFNSKVFIRFWSLCFYSWQGSKYYYIIILLRNKGQFFRVGRVKEL